MIRRNDKIISTILAMTIVSGLATPVCATEVTSDNSADQVFSLENADLEKISDDTDILEEVSDTEELENNEASSDDVVNNTQDNSEQAEDKKDDESSSEVSNEEKGEVDVPLYDSIDEEMENYLKEYLESLNSGVSDEELEKLLQEYLNKVNEENTEANNEELVQLEDGIYSVDNYVLKINSDEQSMLRSYLSNETKLEVKDGKISIILTFDTNVNTLDNYKIIINDKDTKFRTIESNNSILRIKFNINKMTDNIILKTDINNDYYSKNEECRVVLDMANIEKFEEELEAEESTELEDGTYLINNNTLKLDKENQSVLENYLSKESILEVKNGQKYLTLIFDNNVSTMSNYQIYVNSYNGGYKIVESNEEVLKLKFEIESLDDEIVFETNITNEYYSEQIKARIVLDSDSIQKAITKTEMEEIPVVEDVQEELEIMGLLDEQIVDGDSGYDITVTDNSDNKLSMSKLFVKEGKMVAQFTFDDAAELGTVKEIEVNGKVIDEVSKIIKEDKDSNTITIETPISSFNDVINITFSKVENNEGWNNTSLKNIEIKDIRLNKGTYELEATSNANKYVSAINLEINDNGKMYLITTFSMGSMITVTDLHVNNKSESYSTKLAGQGFKSTLTVKSEISSLDDIVNMFVDINLTAMGMGIMSHDMEFTELRFKGVSAPKDEIENEEPEEDDIVQGIPLEDGEYTIGTSILKTGTQEGSMAASFFDKESNLSVKDKKYNLSVNSNSLSMMSNIVVKVDGNTVAAKIVPNSDGKSGTISFEIPRLNSKIVMYCHVDAGAHVADYDFAISLDKNNIINKDNNEKVEPPVEYEQVELTNNTAYKINNKIKTSSSDESSALASFVDDTSVIEVDSNGNIYLTINFTMSGLMNGRTVRLNNNENVTTYAVVNSNNTNGIRFKINSLNDKIYISNQYGSSINDGFSLVLLEDTVEKTGAFSGSGSGSGLGSGSGTTEGDDNLDIDEDEDIEDGTYVIKNYCYKEKSDTTSDARKYLDTESVLIVKNSKKYVILKFTHGKMMSDTSIKVDDTKTSYTVVKNSGNNYYIKFKIDSLDDEIMVTSTIDTGVASIGVIKGIKFRVLLRESTLKEDDDAADFDDEEEVEEEEEIADEEVKVEEPVQDGTIVIPPSNEIIDNNTVIEGYKKSTYKVNNEIVTDSQIGYQAARGAVNQTSVYEIENEKKYITLGFSQTDILNNIRISNNGKNIAYTVVNEDKSKKTMNIKFEVPSLSTQLTVTANVTAMGRDISFGLKFLETTLELISTEESESITNNTVSGSNGSSASSSILSGLSSTMSNLFSGRGSSEGGIEVSEEAVEDLASLAKEYFKKYTVNNEVISDSAIGRSMARKYLSETSIIEEIDGQLYATITFSSAGSMGNFRIDVNGETVSHTVPLKDMGSDLVSLRFPISSVNDDIRTYIFISPMKMTIDFGIKFLEDTMTLIDEGTIGEDADNESSSLADTLSNLNQASQSNKNQMSTVKVAASTSVMVIVLNQGIAGLGSLFRRFKNKSLLSKITNIE